MTLRVDMMLEKFFHSATQTIPKMHEHLKSDELGFWELGFDDQIWRTPQKDGQLFSFYSFGNHIDVNEAAISDRIRDIAILYSPKGMIPQHLRSLSAHRASENHFRSQ